MANSDHDLANGCIAEKGHVHDAVFCPLFFLPGTTDRAEGYHWSRGASGKFLWASTPYGPRLSQETVVPHPYSTALAGRHLVGITEPASCHVD